MKIKFSTNVVHKVINLRLQYALHRRPLVLLRVELSHFETHDFHVLS